MELKSLDKVITVFHFGAQGVFVAAVSTLIVYGADLPESTTDKEPPVDVPLGMVAVFDGEVWSVVPDHRGSFVYSKSGDQTQAYTIELVGEIPDTHTLLEPGQFDVWIDTEWVFDDELELPFKKESERMWRDGELRTVLDRIDQYEKDANAPAEFKTSTITEEGILALYHIRKVLCDYPAQPDFPYGERPTYEAVI